MVVGGSRTGEMTLKKIKSWVESESLFTPRTPTVYADVWAVEPER